MTLVKICGITNVKDALMAVTAGADAIGLVFAASPRRVSVEQAAEITTAVGPWVSTVGVFVNESADNIRRIAAKCRLNAVQLHGDEDAAVAKALEGYKIIKAFRIGAASDLKGINNFPADAFLFDSKVSGKFGGSGQTFDWKMIKENKISKPFIISGGLNPKNVAGAVKTLNPYGVEASSGVEKSPGQKDGKLLKEFIKNAKK